MKQWPSVRQRQPVVMREFRGVSKEDAFSLSGNIGTDASNIDLSVYPALTVRPGYSLLSGAPGIRVLGLGVRKETELCAVWQDGSWRRWNGSAWVVVATGIDTTKEYSFCNFKGGFSDIFLLSANGVQVKQWDGTTLSALSGAPAGLNYIEQYVDRVWGIVGNTLRASGYRNAMDWTSAMPADQVDESVSFYAEIESPDGETCTALKSGLGRLVIFKPSAMYELQGYSPSDYRVDMISSDIGAINNRCVTVLQSGMYFLGKQGIYRYRGDGVTPTKDFSRPVQWFIDHMLSGFSVGTDGKLLFVSIGMSSSTQPDTLLVYDPYRQAWSVWTGHSTACFANLGTNTYFGCYDGSVRLLNGSSDAGTAIAWKWVSKPFTGGSLSQKMRWIRAWLTLDLPVGSTLNVYLSPSASGEDWVLAGSISGSASIQRRSVYFTSSMIPPAEQIRIKLEGTGPCTVYEIARDEDYYPMR